MGTKLSLGDLRVDIHDPDFLDVQQVARRLSLSRSSVYGLMDSGDLPYHKFGSARRVGVADLAAFIARTRQTGRPAAVESAA